jgi:hypothetical protein
LVGKLWLNNCAIYKNKMHYCSVSLQTGAQKIKRNRKLIKGF